MRRLLFHLALLLPFSSVNAANFIDLLQQDTRIVLTAPSDWDAHDLRDVGTATAMVLGTALLLDQPLRDFMRKQDQNSRFWLEVEKFGREYALLTIAALYAGGAAGNDNMLAAAEDCVIASLIASGIITVSIKTLVGRARPLENKDVFYSRPFSNPNSSFPSGHAAQAYALAAVLAEHYPEPWQQASFYGIATLAALARPYHDKHYASDLVASAFISIWTAQKIVRINRELRQQDKSATLLPAPHPKGAAMYLIWRF